MYTLFEEQAFRYCVLHMFGIPKTRAFGQLAKLESYTILQRLSTIHMRVTVMQCNHTYPCTFVSPRFLSQVYWSMNILIDSWRFVNSRKSLHAGGSGVRLYDGPDLKLFILVGWGRRFLSVAWPTGVQLMFFLCSGVSKLFGAQGSPSSGSLLYVFLLLQSW